MSRRRLLHRASQNWQNQMCLFLFYLPPHTHRHAHTHAHTHAHAPSAVGHFLYVVNSNVVSYRKSCLTSRKPGQRLCLFVWKDHHASFIRVLIVILHHSWWKYLSTSQMVNLKMVRTRSLSFWTQHLRLLSHPDFSSYPTQWCVLPPKQCLTQNKSLINILCSNYLLTEPIKDMPDLHILKARSSVCDWTETRLLSVTQ